MGKEEDIPEIPIEEQVRNALLDIQKGQRQLSTRETTCFVRVLGEVIPAESLTDLKIIATKVPKKKGRKSYDQELEDEFMRRRYAAAETSESMGATLNHIRVLLAQRLIMEEIPETNFLGYAQRIIRRLAPANNSQRRRTINVRVNKRYL